MPAHTDCRICRQPLPEPFVDLGEMPLANAFLTSKDQFQGERRYPLAAAACGQCGLVQLNYVVPPEEMFRQYPYVSSTSEAVRRWAGELAPRLAKSYGWDSDHLIVELGSNDGLFLKAFQRCGVKVLGIDPARNLAALAEAAGVPTVPEFFSEGLARQLAQRKGQASGILGRHVFAHIDDLHDFLRGIGIFLRKDGLLFIEVPYLVNLLEEMEFDTIYHEHLSYVSLRPVSILCGEFGFQLIDVEEVPLHGGSVLLTIARTGSGREPSERVHSMLQREQPLCHPERLASFRTRLEQWKNDFEGLSEKLADAKWVGFGAAAKANTLLNFCPKVARHLSCILDRSPHKQGLFTPGTHLPVLAPETWQRDGTTHMLILAWNFKEEIMRQMHSFREAGGRFIIPIPTPEVR